MVTKWKKHSQIVGWIERKPTVRLRKIEPNSLSPRGDLYHTINGIEDVSAKHYKGFDVKVRITIEVVK